MDKRLERMRQNSKNVRPAELDAAMRTAGFSASQRGSHVIYRRGPREKLSVPQRRPFLLPVYVKEALKLLDPGGDQ